MKAVRIGAATIVLATLAAVVSPGPAPRAQEPASGTVTVDLSHPVNTFRTDAAFGAGVDGQDQGDIRRIYTPANVRAMRSAGLSALSYRLRTELGVEAWHWNRAGTWSDPAHRQGYWTSSAKPGRPFATTYGYSLPRRGDTVDQANDTGYSRLDDGKLATFWKSNPYLDPRFTHEPESRHAQWLMIGFPKPVAVNTLVVHWHVPYARSATVEYWSARNPIYVAGHPPGRWLPFPRAHFAGRGGTQRMRFAGSPVPARFIRVLLSGSSHTAPPGSRDVRDRLGFAIREISLGVTRGGRFHDVMRHHAKGSRQTQTYVSSTDPWHRATDIDVHTEQPSFTKVLSSGLTHGQPLLVPVPVLYGTPQDAVAEVRYLHALGARLRGVELGEEPDGQLATPEDYGSLYAQFARAIRTVDRRVPFGGPGYQTSIAGWRTWPDAHGDRSWTHRFAQQLRRSGAFREWGFFSFEWYPFDDTCADPGQQLLREPAMLQSVLAAQYQEGLPRGLPVYISEYGYSAFAGQAEADLPGALLNAEVAAQFLTLGGTTAYLYGYEPNTLIRELAKCDTWGNLALLQSSDGRHVKRPFATYWGARLASQQWAQPGHGLERVYPASSDITDPAGRALVTAYALRRPDGALALMLLNKDPSRTFQVALRDLTGAAIPRREQYQLSRAQYVWHPAQDHGYASPDLPPAHTALQPGESISLPPWSLTVVR